MIPKAHGLGSQTKPKQKVKEKFAEFPNDDSSFQASPQIFVVFHPIVLIHFCKLADEVLFLRLSHLTRKADWMLWQSLLPNAIFTNHGI